MFKKTITTDFFSTISLNQTIQTLGFLTYKLPFIRYGSKIEFIKKEFLNYLNLEKSKIISFYNGRSAIFHVLKLIGVKKTDEVIVNGYTCVTVSNAVIQSGAKIIYSDINKNTLGLDIEALKNNITKNTKVIIIQHTFGKPAHIEKIMKIAKKNNILVIEDCAHSLGTKINGTKLGGFGDFSIFSTGRDKVISSVTGGFLVINNPLFFDKIPKIEKQLKIPSIKLTLKNLMYNIIGFKAYKLYDFFKLGRFIIFISRKFGLITEILTPEEKKCKYKDFYFKLPNSLAFLISKEIEKIKLYKNYRGLLNEYYDELIINTKIKKVFKNLKAEKNNHYRYPILLKTQKKAEDLYNYMKKNGVLLGKSWSGTNIVPTGTNIQKAQYIIGTCKVAEDISKRILLLPNHTGISIKDTERIVNLINKF